LQGREGKKGRFSSTRLLLRVGERGVGGSGQGEIGPMMVKRIVLEY
jgi:hypothetical protein